MDLPKRSRPVVVTVTNNFGMGGVPKLHARVLPLLAEKYEMHLVGYKEQGDLFHTLPAQGVQTHFLPSHGRLNPKTINAYTRFFREYKADIVHSHSHSPNVFCPIAAALARVPVRVAQIHTSGLHWFASTSVGRFKQKMEESLVHSLFTDKIVVVSEEMRDKFVSVMPLPAEKFVLLHNGIPMNEGEETPLASPSLRERYTIAAEELVLGFVGRLVPGKGLDYLLQVARALVAEGMAFRIVVVGGGQDVEMQRLQCLSARIGDGQRVIFVGEVDDPSAFYKHFDALLFTSEPGIEGMSTVVLEAASYGLPVLARRARPEEEIVTGYYSRLCFFDDFTSLAQAVRGALQLPPDTSGRLMHFSIQAMAERLDQLYSGLLASKKS